MLEKITLMELYVIETLRANHITDEKILQKVKDRQVDRFASLNEKFDFTILYALEEAGRLERILQEGYQITFLTFTGLVNVLELKFNQQKEIDYDVTDFTITGLQLKEEAEATLRQMLSPNWILEKTEAGLRISPKATPKF